MTRLKKELVKKTNTVTTERIRRIKDQKKVVNSKNNVKISEFHVKRLLESVENEPEVPASFINDNNNGTHSINQIMSENTSEPIVADKSQDDAPPIDAAETNKEETKQEESKQEETSVKEVEEEMNEFELVGLSPESQKQKDSAEANENNEDEEVKTNLNEELNNANEESIKEKETPEDESHASENEEETLDNRRRRSADDEEDGEKDCNQRASEGESDYQSLSDDETSDRENRSQHSGDETHHSGEESHHSGEETHHSGEETHHLREETHDSGEESHHSGEEGQNSEDEAENVEKEMKSPTFVPRRTGFWDHDDRFSDIAVQESREPPQGSKKLWDKSEVDTWQHDMYNESDQGPKEQWEIEKSQKDFEERSRGDRGSSRNRGDRRLGDFFQNKDREHQGGRDSRRNNQDGRRRGQDGRHGNQDGRRGGRNDRQGGQDNYRQGGQDNRQGGRGGYRQNRGNRGQNEDDNGKKSQDVRMGNSNQEQEWPSLNQKKSENQNRKNQSNRKRGDQSEDWGDSAATEDWAGNKITSNKYDRNTEQGYPYKDNSRNNRDNDFEGGKGKGGQKKNRNYDNDNRNNRNNSRGSPNKKDDYQQRNERGKRNDDDDNWEPPQRSDEYPRRSENRKPQGKGRGRGRGRNERNDDGDQAFDENEKSNREKRIDSLPPRLRDKAREKMEQEERSKGQRDSESQNYENDQYEDELTNEHREPTYNAEDDTVSRDKPKRYSSQRQKSGNSMMDIPGQFNEASPEETRQYLEQFVILQQQLSPDKNVRVLEQQILQLQSQLQQQLNMTTIQQPLMAGMQMSNMASPMVSTVNPNQVYGDASLYNMNQGMVGGAGGDSMGMLNPQINPMVLNQLLAAAQAQQNAAAGGLYVPGPQNLQQSSPLQQAQQQQQQQPQQQQSPIQMNDAESRRSRPAAIPIKPPPGL